MKKNKILHVTGAMNVGGTETMLMNLYRKINKSIEFHFISYSEKEAFYDKEIEALGGKVIHLTPPNKVGFIGAIKEIKEAIKENGPYDAVHTHMLFNSGLAMIAAYLSGVKVRVAHAHTTADNSVSIIRKVYIYSMRAFIKVFSTNYLACSNKAGEYLFGKSITKSKKYNMLPNYIDYEKFVKEYDSEEIRSELGLKKDDLVIGHVGRFIPAKNHKFLIDIINSTSKINKNTKLLLVGDGDTRKEIEEKVKALGLQHSVIFTGVRKDIPEIVKAMNLFILPSIHEGLGLVLLEAQASKVPCLVSEAIQPEVDLGVNMISKLNLKDGISEWAEEALKIMNNKELKNIDVLKAVKEKKYDLDSIVTTLSKVYNLNLK